MDEVVSGHFPNITHDRVMEEIELGPRVSRVMEDEELGFGALFNECARLDLETAAASQPGRGSLIETTNSQEKPS